MHHPPCTCHACGEKPSRPCPPPCPPPAPDCGCRPETPDIPQDSGNHGENGGSFDSMYLGSLPLAMAYVPFQRWKTTYSLERALQAGTVFPELDLPFTGGMKK